MKNLILSFVLMFGSLVAFSQKAKIDSLYNLLDNSLLYKTNSSFKDVVDFKLDSIKYPNYFIDTLGNRYGFVLSMVSYNFTPSFTDIIVEIAIKNDDGTLRWVNGMFPLSNIENLHKNGKLTFVVREHVRIEDEIAISHY